MNDLKEEETVSIYGEVLNPGTFLYSDKMTIEDLVVQAGGLREAAATTRVSVTRSIKDPKSTAYSSKLAETFAFDIKDGLVIGDADFYLQPFDMVQIRRSPAYKVQRTVSVSGEDDRLLCKHPELYHPRVLSNHSNARSFSKAHNFH